MMQEGGVEATTNWLVAAEAEGQVAYTTADFAARACALDLTSRIDEVNCKIIVLDKACANCEDVWVKDNVLWVESSLLCKNLVSTLAH